MPERGSSDPCALNFAKNEHPPHCYADDRAYAHASVSVMLYVPVPNTCCCGLWPFTSTKIT